MELKDEKKSQLKNLLDDLIELTKDDLFDIDARKQLINLLHELNSRKTNYSTRASSSVLF